VALEEGEESRGCGGDVPDNLLQLLTVLLPQVAGEFLAQLSQFQSPVTSPKPRRLHLSSRILDMRKS
jgi:hypothetical protein